MLASHNIYIVRIVNCKVQRPQIGDGWREERLLATINSAKIKTPFTMSSSLSRYRQTDRQRDGRTEDLTYVAEAVVTHQELQLLLLVPAPSA